MARLIQKLKSEIGMSPDAFIYRGKNLSNEVLLRVIDYDADNLTEETINSISETLKYTEKDTVTWLNVDGIHNYSVMEAIASGLNIERLTLADVMNTDARSTIKEFDHCIFVSAKMIQYDEVSDQFSVENLSIIITESFLISFQEKRGDVFEPIRERIRKQKKRIRSGGTDYLLFALLDIVIDNYIYILSLLGEKIELLEDNLLLDPRKEVINEINEYKRELNFLRKNIKPTKETIIGLAKLDSELIEESTGVFYKELQDNINQASDVSDSYREILSDQLNIYHTTISSKLNDVMKFLTVFSVIFIPLTFIAGIYGTNFDYLPELHYKYSYYIMLAFMVVVAFGMLVYFKRKKWF